MVLAAYLRECGYEVVEVKGPEDARHLLSSGAKANVAFIDLAAEGEIDGFGLAQ
jgi:hypothetical protein